MIDFDKHIISSLFECVDQVGNSLVANTYHNLVQQYAGFMWTMASIYVGFFFIRAIQGKGTFDEGINAAFKVVIIMLLALNYSYFCLFIYNIFTQEPLILMKAISINGSNSSSISQGLDNFLNTGTQYSNKLFLMGGWSNITYTLFGLLVFVATALAGLIAAGIILLSKCALMILLALSPLFIFCGLYEATKGIFEAYIQHLITYALIPVLTCTILMILFSVIEYVIKFTNAHDKLTLSALWPFILMCLIQTYLLAQVHSKASALGGGFALAGVISTLSQTKNNMQKLGQAATGGKIGQSIASKAIGSIASSMGYTSRTQNAVRMNRYKKYKK